MNYPCEFESMKEVFGVFYIIGHYRNKLNPSVSAERVGHEVYVAPAFLMFQGYSTVRGLKINIVYEGTEGVGLREPHAVLLFYPW